MKNNKFKLIAAMLIFGTIGLFVKNIHLPSSIIALVRGFVGSIFLLLSTFVIKNNISWNRIKPNLGPLIVSGAAMGVNWIFLFEAYKYTTISKATLCYYIAPVLVIILSIFIFKEKMNFLKLVNIICALVGMYLVVGVSSNAVEKNSTLGIVFGLAAAALYTTVMISNKFIKNLSGIESSIVQLLIAAIVLLPYVLINEKIDISQLDLKSIMILAIVSIVHTGIAYLLYFSAIPKLSGQTIGVLSYIDPISAILLSAVFLGEKLTLVQIAGGILILGTTFINEFSKKPNN